MSDWPKTALGPLSDIHDRQVAKGRSLLTRQSGGQVKTIRAVVRGAVGVLLSMSAAGQGPIASDQPVSGIGAPTEPTMMRVAPYPGEMHTLHGDAPPSCLRIGRCSAYDLYRFRDRPNRLTRLAPEAPTEGGAGPPSIHYLWFLVPVTP